MYVTTEFILAMQEKAYKKQVGFTPVVTLSDISTRQREREEKSKKSSAIIYHVLLEVLSYVKY